MQGLRRLVTVGPRDLQSKPALKKFFRVMTHMEEKYRSVLEEKWPHC
jgi:hypothetical protein